MPPTIQEAQEVAVVPIRVEEHLLIVRATAIPMADQVLETAHEITIRAAIKDLPLIRVDPIHQAVEVVLQEQEAVLQEQEVAPQA